MHDDITQAAPFARGQLRIPSRFEGPPGIANGGYLAGLFVRELGNAEVTLRRPTSLETPLWLQTAPDGRAELTDDAGLLATAVPADPVIEPPRPVSFDRAVEARARHRGFVDTPFRTCFVCGPDRAPGDALRIFAGPIEPGRVAAPWVPGGAFARDADAVAPEYVVAALDCPGAWAIASVSERLAVPMLLGRMTVRLLAPVRLGLPHVVVADATGEDRRKRFATAAVYDHRGRMCALADQTWFTFPRS